MSYALIMSFTHQQWEANSKAHALIKFGFVESIVYCNPSLQMDSFIQIDWKKKSRQIEPFCHILCFLSCLFYVCLIIYSMISQTKKKEKEKKEKMILLQSVPCPVHIFGSGKEFEPKCPLYRNMGCGKRHGPIRRDGENETCLHQIRNNLLVITLNLHIG